ncbi:MAG: ATPase [Rhodobacteraceae bacterium]|nr:ATPase [Paracoccaceae bacterium]
MRFDADTAVIGVDGGGTSCRFALESRGQRHELKLGSANVTTDFDGALATIRTGLDRLCAEAGLDPAELSGISAYLGLAGVLDDENARRLRAELPFRAVQIEDDRRSAVRGALGDADGSLAGVGTGSFLARQSGGRIRLVGGWGARLGDEASGFWIGHRALAATLDSHDGLIAPTDLTSALLAKFGGRPGGIVRFGRGAVPAEFGALAPLVIDAAAAGDPVGRQVLESGARYLSETLRKMGWRHGEALCLIGGVAGAYRPYLPAEMVEALVAPRGTALDGALSLARRIRDGLPA